MYWIYWFPCAMSNKIAILNFSCGFQFSKRMWIVSPFILIATFAFAFLMAEISGGLLQSRHQEKTARCPGFAPLKLWLPKLRKPPEKVSEYWFVFSTWLIVSSCFILAATTVHMRFTSKKFACVKPSFVTVFTLGIHSEIKLEKELEYFSKALQITPIFWRRFPREHALHHH